MFNLAELLHQHEGKTLEFKRDLSSPDQADCGFPIADCGLKQRSFATLRLGFTLRTVRRQGCTLSAGNFRVCVVTQSVASVEIRAEVFFGTKNFHAEFLLLALAASDSFPQIATELLGDLAADGPDFFQRLVTFRIHNLFPAVAAGHQQRRAQTEQRVDAPAEAARSYEAELERLSFKGTVDAVRQFSAALAQARSRKMRHALWQNLLATLARDRVPRRPDRSEPRAVKRRPKPYPLLNKPRRQFVELPHRNQRWKGGPIKYRGLN